MVKAKKIKSAAKEDAPKIADNNNTSKQKTAVKKGNSKKAIKKIRKKPLKTVKSGGASSAPKSKKVELSPAKTLPSPKRKQTSQAKAETEQETSSVNGTCEAIYETHQGIQTESDSDQIVDSADMKGNGCLKIITWNVAGLRALVKKGSFQFLKSSNADIILLQETKCAEIPKEFPVQDYHTFINASSENVGYAGVVLLSKQKPIKVNTEFDTKSDEIDTKGRLILAEYEKFYLINAYVPNSGRGLVNLAKRKVWDKFFLDYIKELDAVKPIIYTGDLNVAHQEIDLANPKTNRNKTAGFTDQERGDFTRLLDAGFVDVFRHLHPNKKGAYTFWSRMHNARATNTGWRLDYFLTSERLIDKVQKCEINSTVLGSDHCPLTIHINV